MTKQRRSSSSQHRERSSIGSLVNLAAIPIFTGLIVFGGFYFTTRDDLVRHDKLLEEDTVAREKLRDQFLDNTRETAKGIASLAAHALVQDERTKTLTDTLDKINTKLDASLDAKARH